VRQDEDFPGAGISELRLPPQRAGPSEPHHSGGGSLMAFSGLSLYSQAVLLLAGLIALTSFLMLGQSRLVRLVLVFALQGILLAATTAMVAGALDFPHLY